MKIGLLGLVTGDWTDVNYDKIRIARDWGFHGVGAHLSVPASTITDERAANVRKAFDDNNMPLLQVWGPYPSIVTPDEDLRKKGVEGARDIARLAAKMGVKESGVRPTTMAKQGGDYAPHPDNYTQAAEDRLVKSLSEIVETGEQLGVDIVLEVHISTTMRSAKVIRRMIEKVGSKHLKLNLDLCNFVGDFETAFNPAPMINEMFDLLGEYTATVHLKDYLLEDRFVIHISETVIGTGMMDFNTILRRVNEMMPDGYVVIEHLPLNLIPLAKRNLTKMIQDAGYKLG